MNSQTISKKATLYLDPRVHKALRLRAAESERTISDVTNQILVDAFAEDVADIESIKERRVGQFETYEEFLKKLKAAKLI